MDTVLEKVIGLDYTISGNGSRWRNTEEHSSLVLDLQEQTWFWNSRDIRGGPLDYLIKVRGMPLRRARDLIKEISDAELSELVPPVRGVEITPNRRLVDIFWKNGVNDRSYWYNRCLTDRTIDAYKLGKYDGYWTLPIFVNGDFRNFQCRTDHPNKKIRPWYRGMGPLLFNSSILPFISKVYITEGPVDAILLNQHGFPAISHTGGSSGWSDAWFPEFNKQSCIVYVADNDSAGYAAAKKVAKSLGEHRVRVVTFDDYPVGFDTVDFFRGEGTADTFGELVERASPGFKSKELYDRFNKRHEKEKN